MTRPTTPVLLAALLTGLLTAGGALAAQADQVRASQAWIRVLPDALPAAGYVTLRNDGEQPAILRGASSPAYAQIMLHRSDTSSGMSHMSMLDRLTIPAHGQVALAPAGYHLMLMDAATPVKAGQTVTLTLRFDDGSTLATDFLAKPANAQ